MKLLVCILLLSAAFISCNKDMTEAPSVTRTYTRPQTVQTHKSSSSSNVIPQAQPAPEATEADCLPESSSSNSNTEVTQPQETTTETVTTYYVIPGAKKSHKANPAPEAETIQVEQAPEIESTTVVVESESSNVPSSVEVVSEQPQSEANCETPAQEVAKPEASSNTTTTTVTTTFVPFSSVAFTEVSTSLVGSNSLVDQLLVFGANHIITVINKNHSLSDVNFTVTKVNHLYVKTIGDYIHYKFDLQLSNSQGDIINTVYCVEYCNTTGEMKWISYKWNLIYPSQSGQTETITTTETVIVTEAENAANVVEAPNVLHEEVAQPAPETETVVVVEQESQPAPEVEECDVEQSESAVVVEAESEKVNTETTTTTETVTIVEADVPFTEVSTSLIGSDDLVDQLLIFGASHIVTVVNQKHPLSDVNFTVTKVNHLYVKTIGDYIHYKFDLQLNNSQGYVIDTVFCVEYCNSTGKMKWVSYKWNLIYYPPQQTETITTTETVTIIEAENSANVVEAPNVIQEEAAQPAPETETVVVVEQESQPAPEVEECVESTETAVIVEATEQSSQPESESNTTTTTTIISTPDSSASNTDTEYTTLSASDCSNATIQTLISEGSKYVVAKAIKQGAPSTSYDVSKINSAQYKRVGDCDSYEFSLVLTSSDGSYCLNVDVTIEVKSDGSVKVTAYKFSGDKNAN